MLSDNIPCSFQDNVPIYIPYQEKYMFTVRLYMYMYPPPPTFLPKIKIPNFCLMSSESQNLKAGHYKQNNNAISLYPKTSCDTCTCRTEKILIKSIHFHYVAMLAKGSEPLF